MGTRVCAEAGVAVHGVSVTASSADASVAGPLGLSDDGAVIGDEGVAEGTCSVGVIVGVGVADVVEAEGVAEGEGDADADGDALADAEGDAVALSVGVGVGLPLGLADESSGAAAILVGRFARGDWPIGRVAVSRRDLLGDGDGDGSTCASFRNGDGVTASLISSGTVSHATDTPVMMASG